MAAKIESHQLGLLMTPAKPDYVKQILEMALNGDLYSQWELFARMEEWDRLAKNLNEVKNSVKRLRWSVTPYAERGEKPTPRAQEKADLVEAALKNWEPRPGTLESSFEEFIYDGLDALGKGISVQEVLWQQRGGVIVPRAAHLLTPRQYAWNASGTELGLIVTQQNGTRGARPSERQVWREFAADQFVVGTWKARSGIPGATALLRALVPYWIGHTYGWRWLMQTAQLFGVPFRWATYDDSSPGLASTIAEMLEAMGSTGWAAFPAGTTLDFKEAVTSARDNPQALILEQAKKACDLLILGQELSSESEASGLGSGNATLQGKVRQDVLHNAAAWVGDLVSYQLVGPLLRLNYGSSDEAPEVCADLSIDPDPMALAERDAKLVEMGMKIPLSYAHERHNVPEPEEGESVIERGAMPETGPGGPEGFQRFQSHSPSCSHAIHAKSATDQVIDAALENLTGVEAKWLGGIKPFFRELFAKAKDATLSDAEFVRLVDQARAEMPELFAKMNHDALAEALEAAMGAACVNGAIKGYMERRGKVAQRQKARSA